MQPTAEDRRARITSDATHASEALLRLQIAEYEALMNRGNYFMTFYVGITGVVAAVLLLVVPEWLKSDRFGMLWLGGAAVQIALHMYASYVEEHYLLVTYVENDLRRAVVRNVPLLSSESFWQYETFLARRPIHENWWGEWLLPAGAATAFAAGVVLRREFILDDAWWIVINGALLALLIRRAHLRRRLRKRFSERLNITPTAA